MGTRLVLTPAEWAEIAQHWAHGLPPTDDDPLSATGWQCATCQRMLTDDEYDVFVEWNAADERSASEPHSATGADRLACCPAAWSAQAAYEA